MAMYDTDWGYVLGFDPQTHRQALTFINIIHVPFNKREAKKKERNKNVYISCTVSKADICIIGGSGDDILVSRLRGKARASSFCHWFQKNEEFIVLQKKFQVVWKKKHVSQSFFSKNCMFIPLYPVGCGCGVRCWCRMQVLTLIG